MPNIESIPDDICLYDALDPYHFTFDNKPLRNIIARQKMINTAVDMNTDVLASAKGSTGSLADRLNASLADDGHLIPSSVDLAMHTIDAHTDTVDYVRMTMDERDKLALIADEATNIQLSFETAGPSNTPIDFNSGAITFADSPSINWRWTTGEMYLDVIAAPGSHTHFYDQAPANPSDDYMTYHLPFTWTDGAGGSSLRVYVNGARVSQDSGPIPTMLTLGDVTWSTNSIASVDPTNKIFILTNPISQYDLITVDFDRSL